MSVTAASLTNGMGCESAEPRTLEAVAAEWISPLKAMKQDQLRILLRLSPTPFTSEHRPHLKLGPQLKQKTPISDPRGVSGPRYGARAFTWTSNVDIRLS